MSRGDKYFSAPLAILRSGTSALEALDGCLNSGLVNAGFGYRETHGEGEFEALLEEADIYAEKQGLPTSPPYKLCLKDASGKPMSSDESKDIWRCAQAGAKLCAINGGNRAVQAQDWATNYRRGEVFFRIRSDWLWGAIYTARIEAGEEIEREFKPLSWREFRILAAILSAPVNKARGFTFLGWESIQARACGFHSKALFNASKGCLPPHCQPLSRSQIDLTTSRLEVLKFYLRFRYSKGDRGGKTAYSFRHESREKLAAAVGAYQTEYCFKQTLAGNRAKDREFSARLQAASKGPAT